MLDQIRIVLIETSHSGNIGSTARAMKTMGFNELYLVNPKQNIDEQAIALSAGAEDVVKNAIIVDSFDKAIADCSLVIGTSARLRHLQTTLVNPKECADKVMNYHNIGKVAIIFGRERVGLTNDELLKCRYHLNIPANPHYSSLNLAMAVQLICYELRMAYLSNNSQENTISLIGKDYPKAQELEYFFYQTEKIYQQLGFIKNQSVIPKLQRLYQRAELEKNELNILMGMLKTVDNLLNK